VTNIQYAEDTIHGKNKIRRDDLEKEERWMVAGRVQKEGQEDWLIVRRGDEREREREGSREVEGKSR
jgi:hypothetical protein